MRYPHTLLLQLNSISLLLLSHVNFCQLNSVLRYEDSKQNIIYFLKKNIYLSMVIEKYLPLTGNGQNKLIPVGYADRIFTHVIFPNLLLFVTYLQIKSFSKGQSDLKAYFHMVNLLWLCWHYFRRICKPTAQFVFYFLVLSWSWLRSNEKFHTFSI